VVAKLPAMIGEVIAGRYELEELVGRGGMSSVYRAHDRLLERKVALKLLHEQYSDDSDYVERFRREARSVAQLSHANIVTVIDRGEADGRQFIVFEYVDGENLKEFVTRCGALPVRRALELGVQIGGALAFAHRQGLVHRDVKPQNILLDRAGPAKVTDFGIARTMTVQGLTQTGTVLGTAVYIAPEQAKGEPVDEKTDVYSLGIVLFELLTGEVPFQGDSFVAVAMRHVNDPPPSLADRRPEVPLRLDAAVQRALAKRPEDRFGSMDELVAELRACLAELRGGPEEDATMIVPAPAPTLESVRREARARRRVPWVWLAAALVAVGTGAAALLLREGSNEPGGQSSTRPIALTGVGVYDPPPGDQHEHDELIARATDRNPQTYWTTEHYSSFQKPGVGLVLVARGSRTPTRFTVKSDTPGFTAEIRVGSNPDGPFGHASDSATAGSSTTFQLDQGASGRYFVVWITRLAGDVAHLNEVSAR
jgi:eukaryotic-like serine/threonine-protein kinase